MRASQQHEGKPVPDLLLHANIETHAVQVEKHIRKNNLTVTFTDQLGQAKHSEHVTGEKEARKLAFYLFWNIKPYFTRCAISCTETAGCSKSTIQHQSMEMASWCSDVAL